MNDALICPHCGGNNPSSASFCTTCGKALPSATPAGPRVVSAKDVATTSAGKSLQTDLLKKESRKAAGALLAVAILQAVFGTFIVVLAASGERAIANIELSPAVFITVYGIAVLFFGLFLWARKNPLPAAIVGLVLFISVHLLDAVADPSAIVRGIIIKIIVIVVLIKAIQAGARHRQILKEST